MGGADLASPGELDRVNDAFVACVQAATGIVRTPFPGTRWGRAMKGGTLLEEFLGRHLPSSKRRRRGRPVLGALRAARRGRLGAHRPRRRQPHDLPADGGARHLHDHGDHDDAATSAPTRSGEPGCATRRPTCPTAPTLDQLDGLESFDLVMKECLRLVPPVPGAGPSLGQGDRDPRRRIPLTSRCGDAAPRPPHGGVLARARASSTPSGSARTVARTRSHRHAWEPFGGGVHKCLGHGLRRRRGELIVHQLLRRFDWPWTRLPRPGELPLAALPQGRPAGRPAPQVIPQACAGVSGVSSWLDSFVARVRPVVLGPGLVLARDPRRPPRSTTVPTTHTSRLRRNAVNPM